MKLSISKKWTAGICLLIVALICSPFIARYLLDSHELPEQQLNKLEKRTKNEVSIIMKNNVYSVKSTERECVNQGEDEFLSLGRDTIWCIYGADINISLSGKEIRKLVESAGWKRRLYDDGSGSEYMKNSAFACSVSDGNIYKSRQEAEETYVNGLLKINCQSYTDHYNSPLKQPFSENL